MCGMNRSTVLVLVALLVLTGCASPETSAPEEPAPTSAAPVASQEPEPEMIPVTGAVALGAGAVIHDLPEAGKCSAHSEYTDIKAGAQVVVTDAAGAVVATTELGDGAPYADSTDCVWPFDVEVPAGGGFYTATVTEWSSTTVAEDDLSTTIMAILPAG